MKIFSRLKKYFARRGIRKKKRLIRRYYKTVGPEKLWVPPQATRRQFRFMCMSSEDGSTFFKKIPDRIKDVRTLRRWLVRLAPFHVYYTTSTWLDPQRLGPKDRTKKGRSKKKGGYSLAHNVFLNQELYFDIDMPGKLEAGKKEVLALKDFLHKEYGFKDFRIIYSGGKGFHLHVYDFDWKKFTDLRPEDPRIREGMMTEIKADIVNKVAEAGLIFDADVTMDTRRIIRLPGTVHGKSLNLCEFIQEDDVDGFRPTRIPH
jgi:DNA primase catalytic subunit